MDSTSPVSTPAAADSSSTSPTQEIDPNERPAPNERPDYLTPPTASAFKSTEPSDVEIEIPLNPPKEPLKFAKGLGKQLIDERIGDASKTITATTPQGSDSLPAKSCPHCKKPVLASDTICGYCQLSLKGQKEDSYTVGFWLRTAAWIIDYMIMYMMQSVIGLVFVILGIIISGGAGEGRELSDLGIAVILILFVVIPLLISLIMEWLYEAMMTASKHQGTVGKILVGIKVTNLQGERIGFWHATARHFAKFLSALPFYLGFMMAGWTEKHQALHDMICSTLVVKREKTEK